MIIMANKIKMACCMLQLIIPMLAMTTAQAEGDKNAGAKKARTCQICHGKGGHSTKPAYPILAGQHAQYTEKQLEMYKTGDRKDPIMSDIAATLSEQDMADLGAFFQSNK